MPENKPLPETLARMERDWDVRAREAPEYYIASAKRDWSLEEFFRSGEVNVGNEVLADPELLTHRRFSRLRMLEIGCGAGRMTRALAAAFRSVDAVDVSGEMIDIARRNLAGVPNVILHKNNGADLSPLPAARYDFVFSYIVFQHVPDREVIGSYVREAARCLKPGGLFKFQAQGDTSKRASPVDTWLGVPLSLHDVRAFAASAGLDLIRWSGEGTQYFWVWLQKPRWQWIPLAVREWHRAATRRLRDGASRPVSVVFDPPSVAAGQAYRVRIPAFAGQSIDISYELSADGAEGLVSGVVSGWCTLGVSGEAVIDVPADHSPARVCINGVRRSRSRSRWRRADAVITVTRSEPPGEELCP
jgi:SAM-dependent methyltransferase